MRMTLQRTAGFAALLAVLLLMPMPEGGRVLAVLPDLLHAPLFAVLGVLVLGVFRRRWPDRGAPAALAAWMLVTAFGGLTEMLQGYVDRQPGWHDVMANALGAGAGILWAQGRATASRGLRAGLWVGCGLMFATAAARPLLMLTDACLQRLQMPQLASFEHPLELSRWHASEARLRRVRGHATQGSWSLRVDLEAGVYPGATMQWPGPDWSAFEQLAFEVTLEDGRPLDLVVKIEDAAHQGEYHDRFHRAVRLGPGSHPVRIRLADVAAAPRGREMDLRRIRKLQLFTVRPGAPRTFYLDNVRLE
jgi:VanZ family protein